MESIFNPSKWDLIYLNIKLLETKFGLFLKKNKADDGKNETFLTLIKSLVKKPAQSVLILTMFINW